MSRSAGSAFLLRATVGAVNINPTIMRVRRYRLIGVPLSSGSTGYMLRSHRCVLQEHEPPLPRGTRRDTQCLFQPCPVSIRPCQRRTHYRKFATNIADCPVDRVDRVDLYAVLRAFRVDSHACSLPAMSQRGCEEDFCILSSLSLPPIIYDIAGTPNRVSSLIKPACPKNLKVRPESIHSPFRCSTKPTASKSSNARPTTLFGTSML